MSIADLLELSSEEALAISLRESPETISRWRAAKAVPEEKVGDLIGWATLRGHLKEVARIAGVAGPHLSHAAALLHDVEKSTKDFEDGVCAGSSSADTQADLPLTRIMDEMRDHRTFFDDPVRRVRALRAEWRGRDAFHDRVRAGDRD